MTNIPDEESLRAVFVPRIEAELEELRALRKLSQSDRATVDLDQQSIGRVSRIDSLQVQAMANAAESRRMQRMRMLEAALERIKEGEFGYCNECGEFIGQRRLEVDSAAIRCVSCAS